MPQQAAGGCNGRDRTTKRGYPPQRFTLIFNLAQRDADLPSPAQR
jgi:hypothetical protein